MKHKLLSLSLAFSLLTPLAYAENAAPVYDVDSLSTASNGPADAVSTVDSASKTAAPLITTAAPSPASTPQSFDQRLSRLEQQLASLQQTHSDSHLAGLETEVQGLRSQVEELSHQLAAAKAAQRADASRQLSRTAEPPMMSSMPRVSDEEAVASKPTSAAKLASNTSATKQDNLPVVAKMIGKKTTTPEKTAPISQPNLVEEQAVYQTAYNLIKAKKYNEAIIALQKMLTKYPSGQFAANAHYWLGELYSLTGENEKAATEFNAVVKHYPSNPRVADSELKLGLIFATQLKWPEAKSSFSQVVRKYPGTSSARLAMEQLKQLKQSGH